MTGSDPTPLEAARALAEVDARRRQIAKLVAPLPHWFAPAVGVCVLLQFAVKDLSWPASSVLGFPLVLSIPLLSLLLLRSQRVRLRRPLWGAAGWWSLAYFAALVFVGLMVIDAYFIDWDAPLANTTMGVIAGVLMGGGAVLMNWWLGWLTRRAVGARS